MQPLEVLYEDNHLLVVNKPAGVATMGIAADETSLLTIAKRYIKQRYEKPGNVYLGVVSRLDAPVSGVVLLARTSKAAARLSEQFRARTVDKFYLAVVEGYVNPAHGACIGWIKEDARHKRMALVEPYVAGAREARLAYRALKRLARRTLLEVVPETGRKHQIRVQLAAIGHPVLGDRKYGGAKGFSPGIALHARRLTIRHPVRDASLTFEATMPPAWRSFGLDFTET